MSIPRTLGRYEIVSRIASGGMAEIFLGRMRGPAGFHRSVVVKRVLPHLAQDEAFRAMFLDEARIVAGLRHANVVHVHELGEHDGELFLVLEYLAGESVAGLLRGLGEARRPLPLALAAHVVAEAAAGLHAAHDLTDDEGRARNVVHRDVSPQNLFVTYDGDVKVLDFGVAKAEARLARTHTGQAKGKLGYMSPEQCRREEIDRRTDVWALGVVLYELITGRRLFPQTSELAVLRAICDDPIPPPSAHRPDCPAMLDRIVMRALEKEPLDRYDTAAELRLDLIRAARELDPDLVPRDALAAIMRELFEGRIEEKKALLTSAPPPAPSAEMVAAPAAPRRTRARAIPLVVLALGVAAAAVAMIYAAPAARTEPPPRALATEPERAVTPRAITPTSEPLAEVTVVVTSSPPDAEVWLDDVSLGTTPVRISLARSDEPITLSVRKEGFSTEARRVTPDVDEQRLEVQLVPADRRTTPPIERRGSKGDDRPFYLFD